MTVLIGHCASLSCVAFHTREYLRARRLRRCSAVFCRWCGNYVPLGVANDMPPNVRVEIRLAELLADSADLLGSGRDLGKETDILRAETNEALIELASEKAWESKREVANEAL